MAYGFSALQRAEIAEILSSSRCALCSLCFSALQRAEIAEILRAARSRPARHAVSVLFNEPKLLKSRGTRPRCLCAEYVSVLFNEPKLLKCERAERIANAPARFSALQRAEIAEIQRHRFDLARQRGFSALQRAEIAEISSVG